MRAAIFYGGRDIRVEEVPDPTPGPGEVLVDVGAAGICGSDLHPYRGANPWRGQSAGERASTPSTVPVPRPSHTDARNNA